MKRSRKGLTDLGKALRKLRISKEVMMQDMADAMGCSVSFLSAIETGSKPMPMDKLEKIIERYDVRGAEAMELRRLAAEGKQVVQLRPETAKTREVANAFARRVGELKQSELDAIMSILRKGE
jgi:transcriptional regulator with XRE-family HTH domain